MSRPLCALCQQPLADAYFETDRGERFCQHHRDADACKFCGLVTDSASGMCGRCESAALLHDSDLVAAAQPVLDWVIRQTGSNWLRGVPIRASRRGELPPSTNGETKFVIFGSDVSLAILVQTPMPVIDVQETLAHEFGHVLLTTDLSGPQYIGQHRLSPQEEEGFCEVLRMLWITHHGAPDSDWRVSRAMSGTDPVYSAGLRNMWPRFLATDRTIVGFRSAALAGQVPPTAPAMPSPPVDVSSARQRPTLSESRPREPERARPSISTQAGTPRPRTEPKPSRPPRPRTPVSHEHTPRERPRLNLKKK